MKKDIELRKKILASAYQDGLFANNKSIEKNLNLNKQTVDYILNKLNEEKYFIKNRYVIDLNTINLGKFAWIFVSIDWNNFDENKFLDKLMKMQQIHTVAQITGDYDFGIKILGSSVQDINRISLIIEKFFPEILETQVHFMNQEYKTHFEIIKHHVAYKLKKIDLLILGEKDQNPTINLQEIAKKYFIHRNTISSKWNNFWKNNVIIKKTVELTPKGYDFIDLSLKSFIIIKPCPGKQETIIKNIIKNKQIQDIFTTIENEIIILVRTKNSDALAEFYKNIAKKCPNIKKTNTLIFLTKKTKPGLNIEEIKQLIEKKNYF
jgi:DNA-binding Lrp family transcriptional regulator